MRNMFLSIIGVALFIIAVGLFTQTNQGKTTILSPYLHLNGVPTQTPVPVSLGTNLKKMTIGNTVVMVIAADNDTTRSKGLGGVVSMPVGQGMLFVFPTKNVQPENAKFWMKGMKIPLDFIWISNNKVSEITVNVPAPTAGTPDNQLLIYKPDMPIDYVLEVNAGFTMNNNIKVGDLVDLGL